MAIPQTHFDSPLEPLIKKPESHDDAVEEDLKLATGLFINVLVTSITSTLMLISFVNFFMAESVFSVICLSCLNIFVICPFVIVNESKIVEKLTLAHEYRQLSQHMTIIEDERKHLEGKVRKLRKSSEGLRDYEDSLHAIVVLQEENTESVLPIIRKRSAQMIRIDVSRFICILHIIF